MIKIITITLALLFITENSISQNLYKPKINGESVIFKSQILNSDREIQIYLPENYDNTSINYPVLYVLDGQRYFLNGITFQRNLTWQELVPEFIIVGIVTDSQKRRIMFYEESTKFIHFLEKELIPKIDKDYRTSNERILFGWEMGASMTIDVFNIHPSLFKSFILASPTHISNECINATSELLKNKKELDNFFYITLGSSETWAFEQTKSWVNSLEQSASQKLTYKYEILEGENHYSTPLIAVNKGLSIIFKDYEPKRFHSLQEFSEFGGIDALKKYYQKRGQRYGIDTDIHEDTKHYLFLQSIIEDDFNCFKFFVKKFKLKEFMADYYNNPMWYIRIGDLYLKYDYISEANEIYDIGLNKFKESAKLNYAKGKIFELKGNVTSAQNYYKNAIKIARRDSLPELEDYQQKMKFIQQ